MAHSLAVLRLFLFFTLSRTLLAQGTSFTTPPPAGSALDFSQNPVYSINSEVQLAWVTNSNSYSVWLWQQAGGNIGSASTGSQIYTKADGQTEAGGTLWQVTTESFQLSASNVFFLALGPYGNLTGATTSHYFNITNAATTSSSTSASSSTSTVAPTSSVNSASSTAAAPAATSSAPGGQGNGSSNSTSVGLGVGLGVGIPIILLLAGLLFLKIRKSRRADRRKNELPAYREEHSHSSEPMVNDKGRVFELPVEMTPQSRR